MEQPGQQFYFSEAHKRHSSPTKVLNALLAYLKDKPWEEVQSLIGMLKSTTRPELGTIGTINANDTHLKKKE